MRLVVLYDMASCRWQHGDAPVLATNVGRDCEWWASNYLHAVRTHAARGYLGPDND